MNTNDSDFLLKVAEKTHMQEGSEGVRTILRVIYEHAPIRTREVSRRTNIPIPIVSAVRRELERCDLLVRNNGIRLSDTGLQYVHNVLNLNDTSLLPTTHDVLAPDFVFPQRMCALVSEMWKYTLEAPTHDVTLDQAPCTAVTALRRALLMYLRRAVEGKSIALIGDDDLVSIAICLVAQYVGNLEAVKQITVLELDQRIIAYIQAIAKAEKLPIVCIQHDIRKPLPKEELYQYDVIETDPPYTQAGVLLFLSRSVELLIKEHEKLLFLSFAHWPADKKIALEQLFNNLGLCVENQHRGFNSYQGASILGSTSTLFELRTTSLTQSSSSQRTFQDNIYTASRKTKK